MNSSHSVNLYNIECAVDNLNDLVFEVMGPLGFNEDPQNWRRQLEEYFATWYRTRAEDRRKAIHAVAQKFVGTERTDDLLQRGTDLVHRVGALEGMLEASFISSQFDITSSPGLILLQLKTPGLARLNNHQGKPRVSETPKGFEGC
ncbi:hypothetical protein GSI_08505 [Ganoderma sinense ZZ0214-1]|uniref:Uncharacterized protein n=1 Tax=Ganoderma sinense ZZ0214-1 TaxID=1077348 RepID=A0A2G8S410_9APHY|nr:hypothetical protein GSI_08505 [Ganoderma sinense ZZ0214-1]